MAEETPMTESTTRVMGTYLDKPAVGSRWRNRHTGDLVTVIASGDSYVGGSGEVRVLSTQDAPGSLSNGWLLAAWHEHWEAV
jgi:hypothetical protein